MVLLYGNLVAFYINQAYLQHFLYTTRRVPLLISSLLPLGRGPPLGCRAEIRTQAYLTASRRATVWATPQGFCWLCLFLSCCIRIWAAATVEALHYPPFTLLSHSSSFFCHQQRSGSVSFWASRIRMRIRNHLYVSESESGSFYQQAKNVEKTWFSTVLWLLNDVLSDYCCKCTVPSVSYWQKNLNKRYLFFVGILKATEKNKRIRIRIQIPNPGVWVGDPDPY